MYYVFIRSFKWCKTYDVVSSCKKWKDVVLRGMGRNCVEGHTITPTTLIEHMTIRALGYLQKG